MRRWLVLTLAALGGIATAAVAVAATVPSGGDHRSRLGGGGGRGYFAVVCGFSHRNQDDPIVFFNEPGRSHDHTYFGNTSTKAGSTPASLRPQVEQPAGCGRTPPLTGRRRSTSPATRSVQEARSCTTCVARSSPCKHFPRTSK
jgi:hypothetical protein